MAMQQTVEDIADHVIGRLDIKRIHDELRSKVARPEDGLFGPDSVMWQLLEPLPVLPFMLIQAGLLEAPQPKIWYGTEYSITRSGDFASRYARSYDAFADWFCGDVDTAIRTAKRIHGYHSRVGGVAPESAGHVVKGQDYAATEEQLMLFTMATQVMPIKDFYEKLVRPLTPAECEQFYGECKTFAMVFGIDPAIMPENWQGFEGYWQQCLTSGELEVAKEGHDRFGPLNDQSKLKFTSKWLVRWIMAVQFNLLPEPIRKQFEPVIPLAKARPRLTKATCFAFKHTWRALPSGIRTMPRIQEARRRAGVGAEPGRVEKWFTAKLRHPFGEGQPTLNTPKSPDADPKNSRAFTRTPT